MDEPISGVADLLRRAEHDRLNVIPTLILLHAIDEQFPENPSSWIWKHVSGSPFGSVWIDFDAMRAGGDRTGSTAALIDLAHDVWNGDVRSPVNDVLHRCDRRRVRLVVMAFQASIEHGRGPVSTAFATGLLQQAPQEATGP